MEFCSKYNLFLNTSDYKDWKAKNPKAKKFELLKEYLTITEHGTICRRPLKEILEAKNKTGKNKDYSKGLNFGKQIIPRKLKKSMRRQVINKVNELIKEGKATDKQIHIAKKIKLIERGR